MDRPKPLITRFYTTKDDVKIDITCASEFWLCNIDGTSYYLKWWGNGWVVNVQESYLCKDKTFKHYTEISSFEFSNFGANWQHVFETKEEAIESFRTKDLPVVDISEEFYHKVYDILTILGGAAEDFRDSFIFNFTKDKYKTDEWRFQGLLGFGGKYRAERNQVDCYQEDENPMRIKLIIKMNKSLKKLQNEK
jgi:hypothetical protein